MWLRVIHLKIWLFFLGQLLHFRVLCAAQYSSASFCLLLFVAGISVEIIFISKFTFSRVSVFIILILLINVQVRSFYFLKSSFSPICTNKFSFRMTFTSLSLLLRILFDFEILVDIPHHICFSAAQGWAVEMLLLFRCWFHFLTLLKVFIRSHVCTWGI